ncbi:IclR family transcriptional regulator [Pseudomonadota bacterium]
MTDRENSGPGKRRKEYSAPALEKGLDMMEVLAKAPEGLTSAEISSRLGRPMGQLFRMLVVLQQRGYVVYHAESERYEMTLKLFELAHSLGPVKHLSLVAAPLMKQLSQDIGQSCHLVIYYAGRGIVVVQQNAPSDRVLSVRLGAEAPLSKTCSGHILLAFAEDAVRSEMQAAIPASHKKLTKAALRKIVERIREHGFECIPSEQIQGVQDIGYPVFDRDGTVAAALVVPFLEFLDGSHPVKIVAAQGAIENIAQQITAGLGH